MHVSHCSTLDRARLRDADASLDTHAPTVVALDASPSRIPVLLGGCGSGRTTLLQQLRDRARPRPRRSTSTSSATATTPERFSRRRRAVAVRRRRRRPRPAGARAAFDATARLLQPRAASGGEPATFLLDEFLELRTFESFPGLRRVLHELARRARRQRQPLRPDQPLHARGRCGCSATAPARFEVMHMPPLTVEDTLDDRSAVRRLGRRATTPSTSPRPSGARRRPAGLRPRARRRAGAAAHAAAPATPISALRRAAGAPTASWPPAAASATSCGCTAPAATARSRRSSKSWPTTRR